jgi:2-oxo-3-hexenedioate decarboxylase
MARELDFFLSLVSTYTYLSVNRANELAAREGVKLNWRPFNVRAIMVEQNNRPFIGKPAKLKYMWRDLERRAMRHGVPYKAIPPYPVDPDLLNNRVASLASLEGWCPEYAKAAYADWFLGGRPAGEVENVRRVLLGLGKDPDAHDHPREQRRDPRAPRCRDRRRPQARDLRLADVCVRRRDLLGRRSPRGCDRLGEIAPCVKVTIDHAAIAREIKAAQDRGGQVTPFTSRLPELSLPDAYDISQRVRSMREAEGARPVGRKIGFTNASLWPIYDVHMPIWGYVYDTTLTRVADARATCSLRGLAEPRIEPEIVLGLRSPVGAGASIADVVAAVEWIACGFEIVQTQFPGWKFKVADTVIDNGLHGRLVVGPTVPLSGLGADPAAALESFTIELARDGAHVESGKGANVLGSPLKAMAHLGAVVAAQGERAALAAGEVVTTGTLTLAHPIRAGETWSFRVEGLPLEGLTLALTD